MISSKVGEEFFYATLPPDCARVNSSGQAVLSLCYGIPAYAGMTCGVTSYDAITCDFFNFTFNDFIDRKQNLSERESIDG